MRIAADDCPTPRSTARGSPRHCSGCGIRQRPAQGGAGPGAAAGRRRTARRPHHRAPARRQRRRGQRVSRRPDGRGRRLFGHRAGRREPRAAGGPARRPGDLPRRSPGRRRGWRTPRPTGPAAPRSPRRPRTATSTNWSSTRCARRWTRCASTCRSPPTPQLSQTAAVWHLSTPITGRLREKSTTALDLAVALHPTPAVGGVPAAAAAELIGELEGDRGFYAGAVGWCDQRGDGTLGGVDPLRAAVGRPPHRRRALRAAASSPNPIPTTKSPKPQRNSTRSCRPWECNQ